MQQRLIIVLVGFWLPILSLTAVGAARASISVSASARQQIAAAGALPSPNGPGSVSDPACISGRLSTVDPRWAWVYYNSASSCLPTYGSNADDEWIIRRTSRSATDWRRIANPAGTGCFLGLAHAPRAVLADLGCNNLASATRKTFLGAWFGHEHVLTINRHGVGLEDIWDGCCIHDEKLRIKLGRARGIEQAATVPFRVVSVHVYTPSDFTTSWPPARVGDRGTLRLKDDIITESVTGVLYCGKEAVAGACGA